MQSQSIKRIRIWSFSFASLSVLGSASAFGQGVCPTVYPTYRLETHTVERPQEVTTYKIEYEDRFEEREVVSYRPKIEERMETREYTQRVPVVETATVNESYTVLKPVRRIELVDKSYYETDYVTETASRQETVTSYKPVTETQYQTQHVVVQRPVTETIYQTQNYLSYRPVDTTQTAMVDNGQYVAQQYYQPGDTRYHLRWAGSGSTIDPRTGQPIYRRGGLGWVPYTSPGQTFTNLGYQPNIQQVAIPQTTYVPEVTQQTTPLQRTRLENDVVAQQVPVLVQKMVPVQEQVTVPYQVNRPVTRLVENKVPVERIEYIPETHVRPVKIQRESYKLETVQRQVPVKTTTTERVVEKVRIPVRVAHRVPVTEIRMVPETIVQRVPLMYNDPYTYSAPITSNYSSPLIGEGWQISEPIGTVVNPGTVVEPAPTVVDRAKPFSSDAPEELPARQTTEEEEEDKTEESPAGIELSGSSGPDGDKGTSDAETKTDDEFPEGKIKLKKSSDI